MLWNWRIDLDEHIQSRINQSNSNLLQDILATYVGLRQLRTKLYVAEVSCNQLLLIDWFCYVVHMPIKIYWPVPYTLMSQAIHPLTCWTGWRQGSRPPATLGHQHWQAQGQLCLQSCHSGFLSMDHKVPSLPSPKSYPSFQRGAHDREAHWVMCKGTDRVWKCNLQQSLISRF